MAIERLTITVTNWKKWNPRKDYKRPTWFAMSNSLLDDPDFSDFSPLEFHALVYIFCQASQRNAPTFDIVLAHSRQRNIDDSLLIATLEKLNKVGIVETSVRERAESVQNSPSEGQNLYSTERERDRQTETAVVVTKPRARKKQTFVEFENENDLWSAIDDESKTDWKKLYPDDTYLRRKLIQAWAYYRNIPRKRPNTLSGWKRVLGSFYEKDWARYLAKTPGDEQVSTNPFNRVVSE